MELAQGREGRHGPVRAGSLIGGRSQQKEQSEPTASSSGEVHREPLQIGERAVVEGAFVRSPQNHAGRLARLERFLPARRTQTPASPGLRPGKPNCGIGVERSLPQDLENSRNSAVMTAQTV